jgi:hypothetical protein
MHVLPIGKLKSLVSTFDFTRQVTSRAVQCQVVAISAPIGTQPVRRKMPLDQKAAKASF